MSDAIWPNTLVSMTLKCRHHLNLWYWPWTWEVTLTQSPNSMALSCHQPVYTAGQLVPLAPPLEKRFRGPVKLQPAVHNKFSSLEPETHRSLLPFRTGHKLLSDVCPIWLGSGIFGVRIGDWGKLALAPPPLFYSACVAGDNSRM